MKIQPRLAALLLLTLPTGAWADCPSIVTGNTAAAIAANSQRLLCQQQELANDTLARKNDFELRQLQQGLQDQQLQRRFDALPPVIMPQYILPGQT